jgi:hypothetical protein
VGVGGAGVGGAGVGVDGVDVDGAGVDGAGVDGVGVDGADVDGVGVGVDSAGRRVPERSRSPGDTGSCCIANVVELITEGLSRNFTYSGPELGWGTGSADPKNPSGTATGWAKPGSLDTESTKKRLAPDSLHASSGVDGHTRSFSIGSRTRLPKGCQSPAMPLATTLNCRGPKAELPNAFEGLTVATAT